MRKTQALFAISVLASMSLMASPALGVLTGTLEQVSPTPTSYLLDTDFKLFNDNGNAALGDVTAALQAVPDFGDEASDFVGFTPGNIALIERGGLNPLYSTKVNNAASAGAVGVLIFDNGVNFPGVNLVAFTTIPAMFLTQDLGQDLLGQLQQQTAPVVIDMTVERLPEAIPEPATAGLTALGLTGLGLGLSRRRPRV